MRLQFASTGYENHVTSRYKENYCVVTPDMRLEQKPPILTRKQHNVRLQGGQKLFLVIHLLGQIQINKLIQNWNTQGVVEF